jgi:hypothetical protein
VRAISALLHNPRPLFSQPAGLELNVPLELLALLPKMDNMTSAEEVQASKNKARAAMRYFLQM